MSEDRYRWVYDLPGDTLRHLAAIAEHFDRPYFSHPEQAAEELVEMLDQGTRPALGWYRRHMGLGATPLPLASRPVLVSGRKVSGERTEQRPESDDAAEDAGQGAEHPPCAMPAPATPPQRQSSHARGHRQGAPAGNRPPA